MKSPIAINNINENVCAKCRSCGLPWNRKIQRRKKQIESRRAYLHLQLCSIVIQSCVRRYLTQRHRSRGDPIEQWSRRCVHYLSTKGPYGARHHFATYQRTICTAAAVEIQKFWRIHRCLKQLKRLSYATKKLNAIAIQRNWRASWCRRSFRIVCRAIRQRDKCFLSLVDSGDAAADEISFCLSGCPFSIEYKQQPSFTWKGVDCSEFHSYISLQLIAHNKQRRISSRRRTTILSTTPRKSVAESRRDKIRKMSQRKWKWFYDKQDDSERINSVDLLQPKHAVSDVSSEADVMTWLTNLNLNGCYLDD